jgi:type IV pilus biogenesis protein CpaD/CtpE
MPLQAINEVRKRFKRSLPELDPETDMSVTDSDYRKAQRKSETLEGLLKKHPLAASSTLEERLTLLHHKQVVSNLTKQTI